MGDRGEWFQTFTGRAFYVLDPRPEDVCVEDVAHHLSLACRFNGACSQFYSVADHSVRASQIVPAKIRLEALLHDAPEAYLGDMIRPLKRATRLGEEYRRVYAGVRRAVFAAFGIDERSDEWEEIERADAVLLATEKRDLMARPPMQWKEDVQGGNAEPLAARIAPRTPREAEEDFLAVFKYAQRER